MDQVSEIRNHLPRLTKNQRAWVMGGVALLIVVVVWFSTSNTPAPEKLATGNGVVPAPVPATPEQVKRFSQQLQNETNELAQQRDRAQAMQESAGRMASKAQPVIAYAPAPVTEEHRERDSNIALSFRSGATGPASERSDMRNLIEAEKSALLENIKAYAPKTLDLPASGPTPLPGQTDAAPLPSGPHKFKLFEGTLIETVLTNRLNGSFTGPVSVLVTGPVYSHDREHVLVPSGSRITGEAQKVGTQGQQRLAVTFHRIVMPDGFTVDLDKFVGLNQIGETGLKDRTNNHVMQIFGTSVALGLVSGFSAFGTGSALTTGGFGQYRQGVASSVGQSSTQVLDSQLNRMPTIEIREGHRVKILLRQDLELPAYEDHRVPADI